MFCLRHYGQDAGGKRTTINYFSTRASANGVAVSGGAVDGGGGAAAAEASTTTVRTLIHGGVSTSLGSGGNQDQAAGVLEGFDGVALDAQAAAEIDAALLALAARQREIDAAIEAGDVDAVAMQIDDPATPLVRLGERASPYYGRLQMGEGPGDPEPVLRIAGEADWVYAGADIPEGYREWIEAAEARGEATPAAALPDAAPVGVAEVKKRPPRKRGAAAG